MPVKIEPRDEIVISGIAGRFPDSDNIHLLRDNLMNKVDLVTDDDRRWQLDHPEIPQSVGKINGLEKFDASFFGVHFKQAHTMDPMCRILMEHTYEAIIDAGINPRQLRGSKTGVFIGACFSESEKTWFYEKLHINGLGITGCSRAMLANRISYWLGATGPSYSVDSACSSSLFAMEHAYRALNDGMCESAIVGGVNLCLHPYVSLQFSRLGVLSPDGRCKSFDEAANGYARSEAICVVFLQKAKDAKRIYATFVHSKTNCDGYKEQGITFPSSVMQATLLKEFYEEIKIPPSTVEFVEAHGTGTSVGDPEELNAIDKIFCTNRKEPLYIGSIKSNLGHSEPASGLCSVAKVIIGMETGLIPPNLHLKNKRKGIEALEQNRVVVVTEPTPWNGGLVGINSFGFGGANAHILLKSWTKEKVNNGQPNDDLPRVVGVSGRTEAAVIALLDDIESRVTDVEYVKLFHDIHSEGIKGHLFRGYTILPPRGYVEQPRREIKNYLGTKRPVWFLFSGMGSQWPGMGQSLMRLPVFAEAIRRCDAALKPHNIDIVNIITKKDKAIFDNILHSFVGIAAIQIGLVDVLRSVNIEADNVIGHSVGELGCAYADDCLTTEQMILSAYSRGLASIETKFVHGSMAAVGLGSEDLRAMCPPDIEIACYNASDNTTISGPAESMKNFVAKLQANDIFAKEVPCSNIPYHSRYIAAAGPKLLAYMHKVIPAPKPRSSKWLSTSVPRDKWNTTAARLSSAEYYTNNLLNPVLFHETAQLIPKDAIVIEIAPHGLLQGILRRSLDPTITNISLTKREHPDNVDMLAVGLGQMFNSGLHPQFDKLYPRVSYPVSRTTPMISPHIKWIHTDDWYVTSYRLQEKITSGERAVRVTYSDEDFEFMEGHVIDGRNLFPATGYLSIIWETIGMMRGELYTEVPIVFEDVRFLRATTLTKDGFIEFIVMIQKGTGRFEIIESGTAVVIGYVRVPTNISDERVDPELMNVTSDKEEIMTSRDIYKELRLRGYNYSGLFRSILSSTTDGTKGTIAWHNNWIAFMDNLLQLQLLGKDTRGLFIPTGISKLVIDTKAHLHMIRSMTEDNQVFAAYTNKYIDIIVAGGIEIRGLKPNAIARKKVISEPVLEESKFVPYMDGAQVSLDEIARLTTHICLENSETIKVKTIELLEEADNVPSESILSPFIQKALSDMPLIQSDISIAGIDISIKESTLPSSILINDARKLGSDANTFIAVGHKLLTPDRVNNLTVLIDCLLDNGFLISREDAGVAKDFEDEAKKRGLIALLAKRVGQEAFILLRKQSRVPNRVSEIYMKNDNFDWVDQLHETLTEDINKEYAAKTRVIFVGEDYEIGLVGFLNCLKRELGGTVARGILIQDPNAPKFSLKEPLYAKQLEKDLVMSVLRPNGVWGSYRHFPLPPLTQIPVRHVWANQSIRNDLSSMNWFQGPIQNDQQSDNLVNIEYASINFRDVMLASGKLAAEVVMKTRQAQECVLGFEFSGVTSKGKRVMGMIEHQAISNACLADNELLWEVPNHWTLEDAATIPCVYGTCYYALYMSGKMKKGDKVLIHAGTGGVGQAAINLALHEGCEIFTTVGTPDKRNFIRKNFPQIPDDHIGNSRNTSFEQMIMTHTDGHGVDIVLNSLAEEKLLASVRCLASGGRFLEIGKFDLAANNPLGLECFLREISFKGVMLDNFFKATAAQKKGLRDMIIGGLKNGAIKPLVRTVFQKDQVEAAFRYMAAGKHIGKVVIKINDEKKPTKLNVGLPRYYCLENRSYIIIGGLGGFGLELVDWLVLRGAKNVVITSRTGIKTGYQRSRTEVWESYGVKVAIVVGKDPWIREDCQSIVETAMKLGPVDAIFNLAVVLKDALWKNQTSEMFKESFRSKAWATKQLDIISRKLCPQLRHFVVFSSVSCGRGNAGQTNYGMSNSVMERICEIRAAEGLPALAVQWGAIGEVGLVADLQEDNKELVIGGTLQQRISSCLQVLDNFLQQGATVVSSMVVAEKKAGMDSSLSVVERVLEIMGLKDLKSVSPQTSLAELGMDSMMAVEIKQSLEREYDIILTAQDIRGLNFSKLQDMSEKTTIVPQQSQDVLTGMKLLMRVIGLDSLSSETCIKMETAVDEGKGEQRQVFLLPGIEGTANPYRVIADQLKVPAYVLQLNNIGGESISIESIADYLLPFVTDKMGDRNDFTLVGYSYGCTIAIELARKLEAKGMTGKLIFIDGSPDLIKSIVNQHLTYSSDEELQSNILLGMMDIIDPSMSSELVVSMSNNTTWEEKLRTFTTCIRNSSVWESMNEDQLKIIPEVRKRIVALTKYDTTDLKPIKSPITLLKPTMPTMLFAPEDYKLGKLTTGKIDIYYAEGNHRTIMDNIKIILAINGDPIEDPDEFKEKLMEGSSSKAASLAQ
ncbi:PREDICTED: fatty acid synthase [Ceratosolen solmsi marchali]|uniref:Fatty acid synthase n=1 Tax=Ceratosolen solmsi marchali TaxID=326594 RepID=A0AAJ6YRV9_9HYME|nr:PREDICTED: fatty acid synthase [Ceratosolen solmsi marchali]